MELITIHKFSKLIGKTPQTLRNWDKSGLLTPSMSVIEIFDVIVKEKGLCSKASFYRYVSSLKSQKVLETETNLRLK